MGYPRQDQLFDVGQDGLERFTLLRRFRRQRRADLSGLDA